MKPKSKIAWINPFLELPKPGLLVSVRDAEEAAIAIAGGVDWIDVKEPDRGPLGAADSETILHIARAVGKVVPISVAVGELSEWTAGRFHHILSIPAIHFYKIGFAGLALQKEWRTHWHSVVQSFAVPSQAVAVVYADWQAAEAPRPLEILDMAVQSQCKVLLIDTFYKLGQDLFDCWPIHDLKSFLLKSKRQGLKIVLAGSLRGTSLHQAASLLPDLVAVRGAACESDRSGKVSLEQVVAVQKVVETHRSYRLR